MLYGGFVTIPRTHAPTRSTIISEFHSTAGDQDNCRATDICDSAALRTACSLSLRKKKINLILTWLDTAKFPGAARSEANIRPPEQAKRSAAARPGGAGLHSSGKGPPVFSSPSREFLCCLFVVRRRNLFAVRANMVLISAAKPPVARVERTIHFSARSFQRSLCCFSCSAQAQPNR